MRKTAFVKHQETAPVSPIEEGFMACAANPKIVDIGTCENRLIDDKVLPRIQERADELPYDITYLASGLNDQLKDVVIKLYAERFGITVLSDQITTGAGTGFIIERIALALCDPGEVVLLPRPTCREIERNLHMAKATVVYVDTDELPSKPPDNARLMVLEDPVNLTGERLKNGAVILKWALQAPDLHVLINDGGALLNRKGQVFRSLMAEIEEDGMRVHHVYDMAQDWGMAGIQLGFFFSRNPEMIQAFRLTSGTFWMPSDSQFTAKKLLDDVQTRDAIIKECQERLKTRDEWVAKILGDAGIEVRLCESSLFMMINLADLAGKDEQQELDVWKTLLYKYEVFVVPCTNGFRSKEPGWFAICVSAPETRILEGLQRLMTAVRDMRGK